MSTYTNTQSCYIMSVPSGYVKVGVSDDPVRRLREIQNYCYEPVTLEYDTLISSASPVSGYALEQLMHQKLRCFGGERREWFKVDVEQAICLQALAFRFLVMPVNHDRIISMLPNYRGQLSAAAKGGKA